MGLCSCLFAPTHTQHTHAHVHNSALEEEKRLQLLEKAVTCAMLSRAGQQRSRLLATLYKDERCHKLPVFPVLKKMYVYARVCMLCSLVCRLCASLSLYVCVCVCVCVCVGLPVSLCVCNWK